MKTGTLQISEIRKFVKFVAKNMKTGTLQISKIRKFVKFVAQNSSNSCEKKAIRINLFPLFAANFCQS